MKRKAFYLTLGALVIMLLLVSGCAPGNERFVTGPAGFWAGLWHGFICFFTFIISLFSDTVHIYEVNNTGGWYDFGFVLGVACFFGGSSGPFSCRKKTYRMGDKEWEEVGRKVEERVKQAIRDWTDETREKDQEWEEIGRKIEDKIKRELRKWAEK